MPMAIPVIMAAFEAYAGATALAAGVEGWAAVAAGLEVAGGALTIAGTVSGNKNLSQIGSIVGLVGGGVGAVDGLASGVTVDTGGAGIDNASHGFSQAADSAAADSGSAFAGAAPTAAADASSSGGLLNGAMNTPGNAPADALAPDVGAPGAPAAPTAPGAAPAAPTATAGSPDYNPTSMGQGGPGTSFTTSQGSPTQYGPTPTGGPGAAAAPMDSGSWFSQVGDVLKSGADWAQQNPALTKVAGGLIQGGMNYYGTQALAEANLNRAKNYQDWVRQRYSDSVRNLTVPTVGVSQAPSSGIIAGARTGP